MDCTSSEETSPVTLPPTLLVVRTSTPLETAGDLQRSQGTERSQGVEGILHQPKLHPGGLSPWRPPPFLGSFTGRTDGRSGREDTGCRCCHQAPTPAASPCPLLPCLASTTSTGHVQESRDGSRGATSLTLTFTSNRVEIPASNIYTRPLLQKINANHDEEFKGAYVLCPAPLLLKG